MMKRKYGIWVSRLKQIGSRFISSLMRIPIHASKVKTLSLDLGHENDALDRMIVSDRSEDPQLYEEKMKQIYLEAKTDFDLQRVIESSFLDQDHKKAFDRFSNSLAPQAIHRLINQLGLNQNSQIADVGCGRGHAAHSLNQLGYRNLVAMDPNTNFYTGTGYLKGLKSHSVEVISDMEVWHQKNSVFDLVMSSATVHHWKEIPQISLELRRKLKPGGFWLVLSEFVANSPNEFIDVMNGHPLSHRFKTYEWAYPASSYVDLISSVGFKLRGVIPHHYRSNEFIGWSLPKPDGFNQIELNSWVEENLLKSPGTVEAFWNEIEMHRRGQGKFQLYSSPQAFIFQRVAPYGYSPFR
jgi:SAM-dependent methyltransferase